MPPFGYGLWLWFKSNPAAQWAAGIVAAYVTFRIWLSRKISREREDAAEEAVEEVIEAIEKETDDAIERVEQERERVSDLNDAERLRLAAGSPHNRGRLHSPQAD
jgi:outer membrane protein TolC